MASRYGPKAGKKVARTMRERKRGTLKSGSGKTVKSRKQAIAIGLSEARKEGGKVPPRSTKKKSTARRKGGAKRKSTNGRKKTSRSAGRRKQAGSTRRESSR
jgi:hypothetical protein